MKNEFILLKVEPETKLEIMRVAKSRRRTMTSFILYLIDEELRKENSKPLRTKLEKITTNESH